MQTSVSNIFGHSVYIVFSVRLTEADHITFSLPASYSGSHITHTGSILLDSCDKSLTVYVVETSPRDLGQHRQAPRQKRRTQYTLQREINLSVCSLMLHQRSFIPGESHLFSVPPKGLGYSCGSQLLDTSACGLMKAWRRGGAWSVLRPLLILVDLSGSVPLLWKRPILKCSFLNPNFSSHCVCLLFVFVLCSLTQTHASLYLCPTNLPHILHTFKLFPPAFTLVMSEFTIVV